MLRLELDHWPKVLKWFQFVVLPLSILATFFPALFVYLGLHSHFRVTLVEAPTFTVDGSVLFGAFGSCLSENNNYTRYSPIYLSTAEVGSLQNHAQSIFTIPRWLSYILIAAGACMLSCILLIPPILVRALPTKLFRSLFGINLYLGVIAWLIAFLWLKTAELDFGKKYRDQQAGPQFGKGFPLMCVAFIALGLSGLISCVCHMRSGTRIFCAHWKAWLVRLRIDPLPSPREVESGHSEPPSYLEPPSFLQKAQWPGIEVDSDAFKAAKQTFAAFKNRSPPEAIDLSESEQAVFDAISHQPDEAIFEAQGRSESVAISILRYMKLGYTFAEAKQRANKWYNLGHFDALLPAESPGPPPTSLVARFKEMGHSDEKAQRLAEKTNSRTNLHMMSVEAACAMSDAEAAWERDLGDNIPDYEGSPRASLVVL